jgi:hypothetical protein
MIFKILDRLSCYENFCNIQSNMKNKIPLKLPVYCDLSCKYASFTDTCLSGACRRESAVYCSLLKKYINKNSKCLDEEKRKKEGVRKK